MRLYSQGVYALVHEIVQRIIHKPVALYAAFAHKVVRPDAYPKVGAKVGSVRAHMARVLVAFINDL